LALAFPVLVAAAENNVLSAGALTGAMHELIPRYEQRSGDTISIVYGNAGTVRGLLDKGQAADVVMLPSEAITDVEAKGLVESGTPQGLAALAIGVAVKQGAPAPDISAPDALRRALLAAKAVAYTDPARATSGKHFDSVVLPTLGIQRFVAFLTTPSSKAVFKAKGMDAAF